MKIKKCIICNKKFELDYLHPYQKYCSLKCWRKFYYQINKIKLLKRCKKWQTNNTEKYNKYRKKYNKNHKKEQAIYWKKYYQKYKNKILKRRRIYNKKYNLLKRKTNINYKILQNLRKRIWDALKNNYKSETTINLVGCSIDKLKQHIENKFKVDMNWKNYGKWHIDHIKPCASFNLSKPSEQKKCFHYKNLQPLWANENLRKNKYE